MNFLFGVEGNFGQELNVWVGCWEILRYNGRDVTGTCENGRLVHGGEWV